MISGSIQSYEESQYGWNVLHSPRYVPVPSFKSKLTEFLAVAKYMSTQDLGGSIVAISSISALVGGEKQASVIRLHIVASTDFR